MDEVTRQRELDDVDAGLTPHEVLQRTADLTRAQRDHALAGLGELAADEQLLELVGLDLTELRQGIDLSGGWSLPCPRNRPAGAVASARQQAEASARRDLARLQEQATQRVQGRV